MTTSNLKKLNWNKGRKSLPPYFCLNIEVSTPAEAEQLRGVLALSAPYGWEEKDILQDATCFLVSSEHKAYIQKIHDAVRLGIPGSTCQLLELEGKDWLAAWREFFSPVECGTRFVILPPWLSQQYNFSGRIPVIIEPKSAFGTGHHATTALCLRALAELLDVERIQPGQTFLDFGTGTGILAIACAKSGLSGLAVDIDPLAVDNALENKILNGIDTFEILNGGMECVTQHFINRACDIILANILAGPLIELAPAVTDILAKNGALILSGILAEQADRVESAYRMNGLPQAYRLYDGEWVALVWACPRLI